MRASVIKQRRLQTRRDMFEECSVARAVEEIERILYIFAREDSVDEHREAVPRPPHFIGTDRFVVDRSDVDSKT